MDVYKTEDEQLDSLRRWWDENGKSALFGVILGLGAIFGWRAWQSQQIETMEAASNIYQSALVATGINDRSQAREKAMEVINNYSDTGYATYARLILAYLDNIESEYDSAEEHLRAALDEANNPALQHEINLRLARIYIANNKIDQALTIVTNNDPGNFASQYNEVMGDIYAAQGKVEEARQAYEQAIAGSGELAYNPGVLNLKLEALR
ncbi:MAG: tetratricopeptide repeat protein [Gammaproteobacteria bacterium]|nr:tetratricopeptide repeat protein [Gammaproteobacteria bacterium]